MKIANPILSQSTTSHQPLGRQLFADLSTKELKSLYSEIRTVKSLAFMFGFFSALCVLFFLISGQEDAPFASQGEKIGLFVCLIMCLVTSVGLYTKKKWGKWFGVVSCVPMCFGLVGFLGLLYLLRAKRVFSGEVYVEADIKSELSFRKKSKIQ